ncbi:MAG: permease-like cell division protein FtsX [Methylococcales bacterium]
MKHYLILHLRAALNSLGQLSQKRIATLANIIVIAIALALPAAFYLAIQNISDASHGLGESTQLTVFLQTDVNQASAEQLSKKIRQRVDITDVNIISKEQGLNELKDYSGFGETITALENNPLPIVLQVQPIDQLSSTSELNQLMTELRQFPEVDIVQLDLMLVKRLQSIVNIGQRVVWILGLLFCLAVIFIVGNTIRLELQTRHDELEITKLMGATNRFVRRPFLYTGAWLGFFGSMIACIIVAVIYTAIQSPADQLSGLYESAFQLNFLTASELMMLLLTGVSTGVLGAWMSASRHLQRIDAFD